MDIFTFAAIAGILAFFVPASYNSFKYVKKAFKNYIDKFKASIIEELEQAETPRKIKQSEEQLARFKTDIFTQLGEKIIHIESGEIEIDDLKSTNISQKAIKSWMIPTAQSSKEKDVYYNGFCFKKTPKIVLGISFLDVNQYVIENATLRIETKIIATHNDFFVLKVRTWEQSYVHKVKISWIAYGN